MEEAVGQDLLQVGLDCQPCQTLLVHPHGIKLLYAVDFGAWAVLHCQNLQAAPVLANKGVGC